VWLVGRLRIKQLEDKLAINSGNSSQAPSKDDFKSPKKRSLRQLSGKKPGGQVGHKGQGGRLKDDPDHTLTYWVNDCPACGRDLGGVASEGIIRRQTEDLPPIKTIVTEHRIELKTCPCCAVQWQAGGCPVDHEFEYGPRIKAICVYLSTFQFIPALRTKQMMSVLGVNLSTGSLDNFRRRAAKELRPFTERLRQSLTQARAAFFDETGMKVKGLGHWVHVAATRLMTLFCLHAKRGRQAHETMNVLPHFTGLLHRDDYHSYHGYDQATHSLCKAHLLRDLNYAIERDAQTSWARPLIKLLLKIKEQVERSDGGILCPAWQGRHRRAYRRLIEQGLKLNPPAVKQDGSRRGRTAQTKTVNLLLRFRDQEDAVLRFMTHTEACFDNNQAERDLRMNKVRQKVSGGFRSKRAGQEFMTIRSLVSTAIKQGVDPIEQLVDVFTPGNESYMRLATYPE
jgi:transposase-like protein